MDIPPVVLGANDAAADPGGGKGSGKAKAPRHNVAPGLEFGDVDRTTAAFAPASEIVLVHPLHEFALLRHHNLKSGLHPTALISIHCMKSMFEAPQVSLPPALQQQQHQQMFLPSSMMWQKSIIRR